MAGAVGILCIINLIARSAGDLVGVVVQRFDVIAIRKLLAITSAKFCTNHRFDRIRTSGSLLMLNQNK